MKIAVLDDYQDAFRKLKCCARLDRHQLVVFNDTERDPNRLALRLSEADAVILTQQRSPFPRAVASSVPKLKLIAQTGRNTDHIDVAACTEFGIAVTAPGGGLQSSTAELTWALILASLRHIPHEVQQLKQGLWQTTVGTGLHGKTLGIYAYGRIGGLVAQVGAAFGMKVLCLGRESSLGKALAAGYQATADRSEFFGNADIVSLHIPLTPQTRGIVTADDLALMKTTALLVNTSRAPLIAEGALARALIKGRPGYAAVDVYESEPVTGGNYPLLGMQNALCTPHLGYVEQENYELYFGLVIDCILAFASRNPTHLLNPEALTVRKPAR